VRWVLSFLVLAACSFGGHARIDGGVGDDGGGAADSRVADARDGDATVIDGQPVDGPCPAELCNGADDDCDGQIDEDFVLGAACDGADGDACLEGSVVCSADGLSTTCDDLTATAVEACTGAVDDDCNGYTDCADHPCCADAACSGGAFCCTGTGLVHTIGNTCMTDFGTSGSGDSLQVYCCDGIARFCLSGEACPWRTGCIVTEDTCSRAGLPDDRMATATCQKWRIQSAYNCGVDGRIYFP